jgi:EmrB/QacA subfamily drug resistance transporter
MPRVAPREVIFTAMMLAIFVVAIEATIVATAMPTIVADLGGLRYFSWVFGSYFLTQVVTIPIYGRLADFFGRKALLMTAISIFLVGSILCGFAHDMLALILFRAVQGIGAGGVQPVASTIVGDLYQGRERAKVQGLLSTTWAFSALVGPLLGAFLIQHFGWPVIFWINVPIGLACLAIVLTAYHEQIAGVAHRIDYIGSLLLAAGMGTLMFVLVMAGNISATLAAVLTLFSVAVLALLVWHEARTPEPMIPLSLYRMRVIAIANAGNFLIGAMVISISVFMPTFVQGALGRSAVVAGTVLGSIFIGWLCGSVGGARMQFRFSYRTVAITGSVPVLLGCGALTTLHPGSNLAAIYPGIMLMGLGFGMLNSVYLVSTQGAVSWESRGAATSSNVFARQIGSAVGSAGFAAVFNLGVYSRIPDAGNVVAQLVDPARRALIPPLELARDAQAIALSLHGVYLIVLALAVVIAALALALPPHQRPEHATVRRGAAAR